MPWAERRLDAGWTLEGPGVAGLPARVPGTVAGALRDAGHPLPEDLDDHPWVFTTTFASPSAGAGRVLLHFGGLATLASVELGGEEVVRSTSMWQAHAVDVTERLAPAGEPNELRLAFAPLGPEVRAPRKPRARWRTKLVANGLRWHRTMLLGRAPGIAPGPAAVGPWRPVRLEVREGVGIEELALRARLDGAEGVLAVRARVLGGEAEAVEVVLDGPSGTHRTRLGADGRAELRIPGVDRWWPHTHGEPVLHDVRLLAGEAELTRRRVGFRTLAAGAAAGHDVERDGLDLHVNGVRTWARGAVWTPVDPVGLAPSRAALRATLEAARDAGMNLLRVVGTAAYESTAFHDCCDELGLLVWQDAMFANLDYPLEDPGFGAVVAAELEALVGAVAGHPSTAVVCGGSEVGQQVAMLGLDPALAREGVGYRALPAAVAAGACDAVVVPDAPSGGVRPFRADAGVANWFGVGGYRRGIADARRAGVRFASECLAFANVPGDDVVADVGLDAGVPRDGGADWDFGDVRDHYLRERHGADPAGLRASDPERYLDLSRAVTGKLMAEVLGEWRRAASPCGGALVLWLRDLVPGSGWGLLDHRGRPKLAWHDVRRALAPIAVWVTDEGLNGLSVHVANDGPAPLRGSLRVALFAEGRRLVAEGALPVELPGHTTWEHDAEAVLGHFADVTQSYGFGPPAHDIVLVALEGTDGTTHEAVWCAPSHDAAPRRAEELGVTADLDRVGTGRARLVVRSDTALLGVRVRVPGWQPEDDGFDLPPGGRRELRLHPAGEDRDASLEGRLTALNLFPGVTVAT